MVLVVIGILTTLVMLRPGGARESRELQETARQMQARMALAAEETLLSGGTIGVMVQPDSFAFLRRSEDGWQEITGDRAYRRTRFPDWVRVSLSVEGEPVDLYEEAARIEPTPAIMILPSGEMTPFVLELTTDTDSGPVWRLEGDWSGEMDLERVDEPR